MSIRAQLSRSLFFALCFTMGALLLVIHWGVGQLTHGYIQSRLQHDAESIISALDKDPQDGQWKLNSDRLGRVYERAFSGHYFVIKGENLNIRSRSLWDYPLEVVSLHKGVTTSELMPGANDEHWLVWSQGFSKKSSTFTITIAEDIAPVEALTWHYSLWAVGVVLSGTVLLLLLQQWVIKKNFRYLDAVRTKIQSLRYSEEKTDLSKVPEELMPLAEDIEQLLVQLQKRVSRSRNSLGNLAHELKRPLQRVQQLLEEASNPHSEEIQRLLGDIQWLIQRELKRARIVGVSSPGRQMHLADDIPPLMDVLTKLFPDLVITSEYPAELVLYQDRDDMLELFGNLLDNACKFAVRNVALQIRQEDKNIVISVTDDGRGLPAESIARLMQRGERLDESTQGAGLGLSICQDIVENYQGSLLITNGKSGGLRATVVFPSGPI
ncbi:sensor histidine kinase [Neptunomonas qingdaonensis]|uniref:histidine kinase n=1 Tax=Neptunomonas qingdaonensis TaxID=1045558 RepID=A0A1I2T9M5_9GAMM|nr:ATP-binding protein [Neptunomonas qingdaonensis]SFG61723.1 Signal transduction histidine kinase [Neptunomonas qingdaonensis]